MQSSGLKVSLLWLIVFSIAMGYLESSVVVYLHRLYYPEGFGFPLKPFPENLALTEIFRETATLIMLVSVAWISGRNFRQRLAFFMICFATWDLFYYIFLKALSGWPESLFTWDILFLIPTIWAGPVIAPVLVSITLLFLAGTLLYNRNTTISRRKRIYSHLLILCGFMLIFISFTLGFFRFAISRMALHELLMVNLNAAVVQQYNPKVFDWLVFFSGEFVLIAGVCFCFFPGKNKKKRDALNSVPEKHPGSEARISDRDYQ
jgi:hypothetical protein